MPRYDFRCPACGETRESVHPMQDIPATVLCPCGGEGRRVYQAPAAIHFKGLGFYSTDVTGRLNRRRRPNPGDDLPVEFDDAAARIADAI